VGRRRQQQQQQQQEDGGGGLFEDDSFAAGGGGGGGGSVHQLPYFEVARRLEQDNLDVLSEVRRFEEKAEGMRDERDRMRDVVAEAVRHLNEAKAKLEKYEPKMAELERKVDTSRQMAYYEQVQTEGKSVCGMVCDV
jgi:hypothetical protein